LVISCSWWKRDQSAVRQTRSKLIFIPMPKRVMDLFVFWYSNDDDVSIFRK
jgi:hypothetical protein